MISTEMKTPIAFDYGGTLRTSDGLAALRDFVSRLNRLGVPVVVVSAIAEGYPPERILPEILALQDSFGTQLQFHAVRFVFYPVAPTESDMLQVGRLKAAVMKELGAGLIFDDSEHVCNGVHAAGLQSVRVVRGLN